MLLSFHNVNMNYIGGYIGLDDLSFDMQEGTHCVFVGGTGSGKTNLARTICGIEPISSGSITFRGQDLTKISLQDRNFGMTFGYDSLQLKQTLFANVAYPLRLRGVDEEDIASKILHIANALDIAKYLDSLAKNVDEKILSLTILARLLVVDRQLYVVDNILEKFDYPTKADLLQRILPLIQDKNVVWLTSDFQEGKKLSNEIFILSHCKIVDKVDDNFVRPSHLATYLAIHSLHDCEDDSGVLRYDGNHWALEVDDKCYPCAEPISDIYKDKRVLVFRLNKKIDPTCYFDLASEYNITKVKNG